MEELKGNRFSIGGQQTEDETHLSLHLRKLDKGDVIYLFSDGITDQFGGPQG